MSVSSNFGLSCHAIITRVNFFCIFMIAQYVQTPWMHPWSKISRGPTWCKPSLIPLPPPSLSSLPKFPYIDVKKSRLKSWFYTLHPQTNKKVLQKLRVAWKAGGDSDFPNPQWFRPCMFHWSNCCSFCSVNGVNSVFDIYYVSATQICCCLFYLFFYTDTHFTPVFNGRFGR